VAQVAIIEPQPAPAPEPEPPVDAEPVAPVAEAPVAEAPEAPATQDEAPAPIPLPGSDDGGPPTQGMPLPLADLDEDVDDDVPSLRPPNSDRTIDVREVRSRHAALDTAAEGDPFLAELRRAMVDDDDDDRPRGDALEGPDLLDGDLVPDQRRFRRRRAV
jgi:hypothetical protein